MGRYLRIASAQRSPALWCAAVILTLLNCYTEIWWIVDTGGPVPGWCAHMALFEEATRVDIRWTMILALWVGAGGQRCRWQEAYALGSRGRWFLLHAGYLSMVCLAYVVTIGVGTFLMTLLPIRNFDYTLGWECIARILPVRNLSPGELVGFLYGVNYLRFLVLALVMWMGNLFTRRWPLGVALVVGLGILDRALGLLDTPMTRAGLLMTQNASLMDLPVKVFGDAVQVNTGRVFGYWFMLLASAALTGGSLALGMEFGERSDGIGS